MRYSQMLIPTLKEDPADAQVVSHQLMIRSGMIRKVAAGIYNFLPLGLRVIQKISQIVREEINKSDGQEILMPVVQPAELWKKSGRWYEDCPELVKLKDRKSTDFCLGPTHEEVITDLVKDTVKSYKQLPLILYQIQTKFRDEIRPRFGVMRGREFTMKDAYSFDIDRDAALLSYQKMYAAYERIFKRCGLLFKAVEADTGNIGGKHSHEFQVLANTGEDLIAVCKSCGYAANDELVDIAPCQEAERVKNIPPFSFVLTKDQKTCADVADFLGVSIHQTVKTVLFMVDENMPVMVLCRGDHEVNEIKLKKALAAKSMRLMNNEESLIHVGPSGFLGPVGLNGKIKIVADHSIKSEATLIIGANQVDHHLVNVVIDRDFKAEFFDLHIGAVGDICGRCKQSPLEFVRGIEVGHIFYLGKKYSEPMQAACLDENGKDTILEMGCYGIGIGRTAAAAIEQHHDAKGIVWPMAIAPFHVALVRLGNEVDTVVAADKLYNVLQKKGVEVLYDDRDERPGVKFADQDLIGCPIRLTVGARSLKNNEIEVKLRDSKDVNLIATGEVDEYVAKLINVMLNN